jgi:hypothetical protein
MDLPVVFCLLTAGVLYSCLTYLVIKKYMEEDPPHKGWLFNEYDCSD